MNQAQEQHLARIKIDFSNLVDLKYRRGQEEHGGNLFDMDAMKLLDCTLDEAIDQVVYLLTLRAKMEAMMERQD